MVAPHEAEINLDAYARLTVALARAGEHRGAVLAEHGLDEARWAAIDDMWQARLSEAMDQGTEEMPVPPFLQEFSHAMERAQTETVEPMPLQRFAEATRAVRRGGEVVKSLERLGLTPDDYLRANHYWTRRMVEDEQLAEAFRRALS
jgi:hypothetical protein